MAFSELIELKKLIYAKASREMLHTGPLKMPKEHNALTVIQCFSLAFLLRLNSSLLFLHSAPVQNADV